MRCQCCASPDSTRQTLPLNGTKQTLLARASNDCSGRVADVAGMAASGGDLPLERRLERKDDRPLLADSRLVTPPANSPPSNPKRTGLRPPSPSFFTPPPACSCRSLAFSPKPSSAPSRRARWSRRRTGRGRRLWSRASGRGSVARWCRSCRG